MICPICHQEIKEEDLLQMDPEIWGVSNVHRQCWISIWTLPERKEEN